MEFKGIHPLSFLNSVIRVQAQLSPGALSKGNLFIVVRSDLTFYFKGFWSVDPNLNERE